MSAAEVSIGSLIVNYLRQQDVLGTDRQAAGKMIMYLLGWRFGWPLYRLCFLRIVSPGKIWRPWRTGAILLLAISANTTGTTSPIACSPSA